MFRSGNNFKYELSNQNGNYKLKLNAFEVTTQETTKDIADYKTQIQNFKVQTENMKRVLNQDYAEIRRDITEEVNDFENKLKMDFNQQKTKTLEHQHDIAILSNDLLQTKNLIFELKHRVASLKLRVEGEVALN